MPRDPNNNPTERILRMISEWQDVVEWLSTFEHPPRPETPALDEEIMRQRVTKAHTESQRDYRIRIYNQRQREYMRNIRQAGRDHGLDIQSRKGLQRGLEDQLRQQGEDIPLPPQPRTPPRLTRQDRELRDEVFASLMHNERWAASRKALDETLKPAEPGDSKLTPEEVALRDKEVAEEFARKARAGLFSTPAKETPDEA